MTYPVATFSFLNSARNCPHKAFRMYVAKDLPYVEPSKAMQWGIDAHEALENRIAEKKPLPSELVLAEPLCATLDQVKSVHAEYRLAMTSLGQRADWDDPEAWFRGKLDVLVPGNKAAWLIDWKTGRVWEDPFELECQAVLLKAHMVDVEQIVGEYFWLTLGKAGKRYQLSPRTTMPKLRAMDAEFRSYDRAGVWPKRRNPLCAYCPVHDCEHNRVRK